MNIWFMASLEKDQYRKPMTGMWEWFETVANHGNTVGKTSVRILYALSKIMYRL